MLSNRIISSGVRNSIVCSVSNFCLSRLAIVLYLVGWCCNKGIIKKAEMIMMKKSRSLDDFLYNFALQVF